MDYEVERVVPERARTRRRILECALELFSAEGFEAATLRQLAERLDLTPAALYYHFASKAEILQGVVEPLLDALDALLADESPAPDPRDERAVLGRLVDVLIEHREIVALLVSDVSAARMTGVRERLDVQNQRLVATLAGGDQDTGRLVRIVAAIGALRRPLVDLPHLDLVEHRESILDAATGALGTAPPDT